MEEPPRRRHPRHRRNPRPRTPRRPPPLTPLSPRPGSCKMARWKVAPVHPGEVLREKLLKPLGPTRYGEGTRLPLFTCLCCKPVSITWLPAPPPCCQNPRSTNRRWSGPPRKHLASCKRRRAAAAQRQVVTRKSTLSLGATQRTMSVILDIDLDYFTLFERPVAELERLLGWARRPVDFVVRHHHEAYARWKRMVAAGAVGRPDLIIHVDEHHDMMSEGPPANFGSYLYFAMRHWPKCRVIWVTPQPIDHPNMWLSDAAWEAVSRGFQCARRFRPQWPKPDLVSVCTSPDFIGARLRRRLSEGIKDLRAIAASAALE